MADTNTLEDLKSVMEGATPTGADGETIALESQALPEPKIDEHGRSYATGKPGNGKITINGRDQEIYFARPVLRLIIAQAFQVSERVDSYDVTATVKGGGLSGQAGAVRHGISKALTYYEPALRKPSNSRNVKENDILYVYARAFRENRGAFCVLIWRLAVTGRGMKYEKCGDIRRFGLYRGRSRTLDARSSQIETTGFNRTCGLCLFASRG